MKQKMWNTWRLPILLFLFFFGSGAGLSFPADNLNILDKDYIRKFILEKVRSDYVDSINISTLYDGAIEGMIDKLDPNSSYMPPETASDFSILDKDYIQKFILEKVRSDYADSISISTLYDGAIEGMIDKLDPHSSYMPPKTASDFSEKIRGEFPGIGITFKMINNKITVIDVIEGGPSEAAGLKSRDKIVQIDGKDASGIPQDSVRDRLRGPSGSQVTVLVERPGVSKPFSVLITRDWIEMNSVSHAYMLDQTTGYIALTGFSVKTPQDVVKALQMLKSKGMKRLVLDLRNNSGGVLDSAVSVVNLFIKEGKIVYTEGRKKADNHVWNAPGNAPFPDLPLIVMINHGSASASEIVAGALQDHDRALIVGQTSFGKGLVMNPFNIRDPNNPGKDKSLGTLVLTVSRYYTPSGRLIQRPYDKGREAYIKAGFDDNDLNATDAARTGKPVFHTDLGRDVYGGGGISPDVVLTPMKRLNDMEIALRNSDLFFEFADEYLLKHNDIPKNFSNFLTDYHIPSGELNNFRTFIEQRDVHIDSLTHFNDDLKKLTDRYGIPRENLAAIRSLLSGSGGDPDKTLFERSLPTIERELKQEIARMVWGSEERYRVWHVDDTELTSALGDFDQANDLLTRRLALKK
ncbi:MAG: S41 family peptidase, partial [Candidatus Latescibacter sp.]|nr:S41 family peptidase [Candidatus Latescibacter sp.]